MENKFENVKVSGDTISGTITIAMYVEDRIQRAMDSVKDIDLIGKSLDERKEIVFRALMDVRNNDPKF